MAAYLFGRIDTNKDGVIGPGERKVLAAFTKGKDTLIPADADKDGQVTRAEFMIASAARFAKADSNRDGKLDKAEIEVDRKRPY